MAYESDFGPFDDQIWLDCAHQGPLPRVAVEQTQVAIQQKITPHRLPYSAFEEVPTRLKEALASLVGCEAEEIILGNSTSYGLNLLVQGLPLEEGDEVLLIDGDFPANVITWLPLRHKGVRVRLLKPKTWPPSPAEVEAALSDRTRVFCTSWVFSFFGCAIDIDAIGKVCRDRNVIFVLNGAQAIGARQLELSECPVDAVVGCGFKWLCGPYGTGFAWIRPHVLTSLRYQQAYWLRHAQPGTPVYELRDDLGAAGYDVFGTANFLNFMTWTASIEYLLGKGILEIQSHDEMLVDRLVKGISKAGYVLTSPAVGLSRSTLVVFSHEDAARNVLIREQLEAEGIHIAERDEKLRISPHLYNTRDEIDEVTHLLARLA